jgi:hypothetical protein
MTGVLEDEQERFLVQNTSLEEAYVMARSGRLRYILWRWAATVCPCQCGGPRDDGFSCFNSAHVEMRQQLREGKIHDQEAESE